MKRASKILSCTLVLGSTALMSWAFVPPPEPAWSQEAPPAAPESEAEQLKRKVEWLERRYRELARRLGEDKDAAPKAPVPPKAPRPATAPRPPRLGGTLRPRAPKPPRAPKLSGLGVRASLTDAVELALSETASPKRRRAALEALLTQWSSGKLEKDGRVVCWGSVAVDGATRVVVEDAPDGSRAATASKELKLSWPTALRRSGSLLIIAGGSESRAASFSIVKLEERHMKVELKERFAHANFEKIAERYQEGKTRVAFIISGEKLDKAGARC